MPKLKIDNREIEVPAGSTLLDAARQLGIHIPTLCFLEDATPSTSCMVCLVKHRGSGKFVPSCASLAEDGMDIESETDEVRETRREALELLLSDHLGDCVGPCHATCPAHMNIPLMIRQIAAGALRDAIATVKEQIALPAVLGRICPAPCEKACRRGCHAQVPTWACGADTLKPELERGTPAPEPRVVMDEPVSICLLKRFPADVDLASPEPFLPPCKPASGKQVGIVGAGPAGLAAAYYLLQEGHACTLFDDHGKPGGMLQYAVPEDRLPRDVLDAEIALIERLGAVFRLGVRVGEKPSMDDVRKEFDAVLIAAGELKEGDAARFGLAATAHGVEADRRTLQASAPGVFAAGGAVRKQKMAVRAVADGKAAAASIDQFLRGAPVTGPHGLFSVHIGRLKDGEIEKFMSEAAAIPRVSPSGSPAACTASILLAPHCRQDGGGTCAASVPLAPQGRQDGGGTCAASVPLAPQGRQDGGGTCAASVPLAPQGRQDGGGTEIGRGKGSPGFTEAEARQEASRCLHCDCRKPVACKLRQYADQYGASPTRYSAERRLFEQQVHPAGVVYEAGKCIACGICIQIAASHKEALGLTFIGRGFAVRVGVPFNQSLADGLAEAAADCAAACPTGALALR